MDREAEVPTVDKRAPTCGTNENVTKILSHADMILYSQPIICFLPNVCTINVDPTNSITPVSDCNYDIKDLRSAHGGGFVDHSTVLVQVTESPTEFRRN